MQQVQPGERPGAEEDEDWAWRRRIRRNPAIYPFYKGAVIVFGSIVAVVGLALVPLPGPGWLIVFLGFAILASEIAPAQRLLDWGRARLKDWTDWIMPKPWWVKSLVGLATFALVLGFFYLVFEVGGVPAWLPDIVETRLVQLPGLSR
jgi:uncharacterized protein (TIGR02611 family)